MTARTSDDKGVCLSVGLSVKRVDCDKTEERCVRSFIPYEKPFSLIFWEEKWLVRRPLLREILGQPAYVAPKPQRGLKNAKRPFSVKIALRLKKVCYKVSLSENCQRQSCKALISLTIRAKMIDGGDLFYLKFWVKLTELERNRRFFFLFLPVAPQPLNLAKTVQLTLIGSPLRTFQWAQDEHRTFPLSPLKGAQKRKVSKIW